MALHSLYCADVPLRNCSLTRTHSVCTRSVSLTGFQSRDSFSRLLADVGPAFCP